MERTQSVIVAGIVAGGLLVGSVAYGLTSVMAGGADDGAGSLEPVVATEMTAPGEVSTPPGLATVPPGGAADPAATDAPGATSNTAAPPVSWTVPEPRDEATDDHSGRRGRDDGEDHSGPGGGGGREDRSGRGGGDDD